MKDRYRSLALLQRASTKIQKMWPIWSVACYGIVSFPKIETDIRKHDLVIYVQPSWYLIANVSNLQVLSLILIYLENTVEVFVEKYIGGDIIEGNWSSF